MHLFHRSHQGRRRRRRWRRRRRRRREECIAICNRNKAITNRTVDIFLLSLMGKEIASDGDNMEYYGSVQHPPFLQQNPTLEWKEVKQQVKDSCHDWNNLFVSRKKMGNFIYFSLVRRQPRYALPFVRRRWTDGERQRQRVKNRMWKWINVKTRNAQWKVIDDRRALSEAYNFCRLREQRNKKPVTPSYWPSILLIVDTIFNRSFVHTRYWVAECDSRR